MALFELDLARVQDIIPLAGADGPSLSWFALTDGSLRMRVGEQALFEHTDEILAHWQNAVRPAEYQVAALVREMLSCVPAGTARLPRRIERLASSWDRLMALQQQFPASEEAMGEGALSYDAWNWLGERAPWASYRVDNPGLHFVRIGDELRIHWDNRERWLDGIPVFTADCGVYALPVAEFSAECRALAQGLLSTMAERISALASGTNRARVPVDVAALQRQHETWRAELEACFHDYEPGVPWDEAERALTLVAARAGFSI